MPSSIQKIKNGCDRQKEIFPSFVVWLFL